MDAAGFVDGTKISRQEAKALIKDIESARTPMEKYAAEQERLKKALDSGAISTGTYNRLLESKRTALMGVGDATAKLGSSISPAVMAFVAMEAAIIAAIAAGAKFAMWAKETQNQIDNMADKADRLGMSFNEMRGLDFAFQMGGGLDAGGVESALEKFQINMAKAVEGDDKLRAAYRKLGLDAARLSTMPVQEAMLQVADAMERIPNHGERMRVSVELMGKGASQMAAALGEGRDKLEQSIQFYEKWAKLSEEQLAAVAASNDAWDKIGLIISGTSEKIAVAFAPGFQMIAEDLLGMVKDVGDFSGFLEAGADYVFKMVGGFQDIQEMALSIATGGLMGDMEWNNLKDIEDRLAKIREQNRLDALDKEQARAAKQIAEEAALKEAEAERRAQKELDAFEKQMKAEDDHKRKMNADALKNAEKYFEDERQRQMKLRDDLARGPGAGIEVGSAEYAKFMAEQTNAALANRMNIQGQPTEEQLLAEAKRQRELAEAEAQKTSDLLFKIQTLIDVGRENGFKRVR